MAENTAPMMKKIDRPICSAEVVGGQEEQQDEHDHDEDAERAELTIEVGGGAFLDRAADLLHLRGALACGEDLPAQDEADGQGDEGDHRDDTDENAITPAELEARREAMDMASVLLVRVNQPTRALGRRPWRLDRNPSPQVDAVTGRSQCRWATAGGRPGGTVRHAVSRFCHGRGHCATLVAAAIADVRDVS